MEKIITAKVLDLKPTQFALGMEEVNHKVQKIKKMSPHELSEYIDMKIIPVVLGPNKKLFLIDHHHFAYSMHLSGHDLVKIKVIADFSKLSVKDFWKKMVSKKWTWLETPNGKKINPSQLPKSLLSLKNDLYRSLSWGVREKNGINPADKVPFFEFMWGQFYRKYITEDLIKDDFKLAIDVAVTLSKCELAKKLPGYIDKK